MEGLFGGGKRPLPSTRRPADSNQSSQLFRSPANGVRLMVPIHAENVGRPIASRLGQRDRA